MKEKLIYDDMIKQQKWAILMGAEFILLKFRMFFYQNSPSEIDFIDNTNIDDISHKIIFKKSKKFNSISNWMLYLSGKIYTQIFAGPRSTEVRLFVKKIKYYKNFDNIVKFANKYMNESHTKEIGEKYLMKYYSNLDFEGKMNYFNIVTRRAQFGGKYKIYNYIIGLEDNYTSKTIEYLTLKWMKLNNKEINIISLVEQIIKTLTFFNNRYANNIVVCTTANMLVKRKKSKEFKTIFSEEQTKKFNTVRDNIKKNINMKVDSWNEQIKNLMSLGIDKKIIDAYIKSHRVPKNDYFYLKNNSFNIVIK